ncbi:GNAT family N-acetyltransferase (plasmid) [Paraburkholderia strydomiana]
MDYSLKKREQKYRPRPFPERIVHTGASVVLEPLSVAHVDDLWVAASGSDSSFDYLRYGPFPTVEALRKNVEELSARDHQPFWAVRDTDSKTVRGWLSLCDIYPEDAAIEIGSIWFSPQMQRSRCSTEAVFLLMRHAMDDLDYQRLVWRCCVHNLPSFRAAQRYGFVHEGVWRNAIVVKGRAMDVAWHSIIADEWPARRKAIEDWLRDTNFTPNGEALTRLAR